MSDTLVEALARRFSWPDGCGVVLAGSTAEGVAMRGSNVNVLVVDAPYGWAPPGDGTPCVVRPMSLCLNHIYSCDPVISLEVLRPLDGLAELAAGMSRVGDPGTPDLELPVLDVLEIRLLSRLRGGLVLHGDETVERWRKRMELGWLPAFHCATTYLTALHFHRKAATAQADGLPLDASVQLRLAVEHLLVSALAADDRVLHEVKNLGRHLTADLSAAVDRPRLLVEAGALLRRDMTAVPELFARIEELAAGLLDWLPGTEHGATAARYLRGQGLGGRP
ncbi:hypothetical protein [Streptosporangium sp. NPDC000239]|uniref:hypothetical protein n=1 Tax=unclassified Streptosporangium TaxID=2632669 RepID=UPI003318246D